MVLGIDTSSSVCSLAFAEGDKLISSFNIDHKKTHSAMLIPMLDQMCIHADIDISTIDAVAVAAGPGSFTGLRIGVATAKGLALSLNIPLIGVSTLLGLSFNLFGHAGVVLPIMDARRNQVYSAGFSFEDTEYFPKTLISESARSIDELLSLIGALDKPVCFLGDGVYVYKEYIEENLSTKHCYAAPHMNMQNASSIALIGQKRFQSGEYESDIEISYLRRPQAERERLGL